MAECSVEIACPTCQAPIEALIDGYTLLRAALGGDDERERGPAGREDSMDLD